MEEKSIRKWQKNAFKIGYKIQLSKKNFKMEMKIQLENENPIRK